MAITGNRHHTARELASTSPHTFHIPVMGTGFTIDSPLRVARYGISSVVSLGDDDLIETIRRYHCLSRNYEYRPIHPTEPDSRARRITAYLDLLDLIVTNQVEELRGAPFSPDSDINRFFELLPDCPVRTMYNRMLTLPEGEEKTRIDKQLRQSIVPGGIDVNIMVKINGDSYLHGRNASDRESNDRVIHGVATSAVRGYARSSVDSSVVLSAGFDRQLFSYMASFDSFLPGKTRRPKKQIILKVSDYRSARVQGRMLTKLGLWPSEFRVESGLNCGGHAFATNGTLMGPILEMFNTNRESLRAELREGYFKALRHRGIETDFEPNLRITAQGGVGTGREHAFLRSRFGLDSIGWGSPFLLVPEVTCVDESHLQRLTEATRSDISLSEASPLNVPFWSLDTAEAEIQRQAELPTGRHGSTCPKGYLKNNSEFSDQPICSASLRYQQAKIKQLNETKMTPAQRDFALSGTRQKTCLCLNLAAGALSKYGLSDEANSTVCCGPGMADFNRVASLKEMIDHIYNRQSMPMRVDRPHMLLTEAKLYVEYLSREIARRSAGISEKSNQYLAEFKDNIVQGLAYYRRLASSLDDVEMPQFIEYLTSLTLAVSDIEPALASFSARD